MRKLRFASVLGALALLVMPAAPVTAAEAVGADCVEPLDLTGWYQELANCNLKGVTISGTQALLESDLRGANLMGATINGEADLWRTDLSGANLKGAVITGTYKPLMSATLVGANLSGAHIESTMRALIFADLSYANLRGATIAGSEPLMYANLTGANLRGATIGGGDPFVDVVYSDTTCPDGTNSDDNGGTCVGHGVP